MSATKKVRINFVGQSTYFQSCALSRETDDVAPTFIDFRSGDDPEAFRQRLLSIPCDVLIAFKPEVIPAGLFTDVPGLKIGWFTEPLPRSKPAPARPYNDPDAPANPAQDEQLKLVASSDLKRRLASAKTVDVGNFDRFIVFDPLITDTVEKFAPVWRALPLPVDDIYFQNVPRTNVPPKVGFFGRPT